MITAPPSITSPSSSAPGQEPTRDELRSLLQSALEEIAVPAFVVDSTEAALMSNASGHEFWVRQPDLPALVTAAVSAQANPLGLSSCGLVDGELGLHLLVARNGGDVRAKLSMEAAQRWSLTPRQAQVLSELVLGASNKDIAGRLKCSPKTIELHIGRILKSAGASSRAQLLSMMLRDA
jgi:DNA-binding CsgD family transcriptional regulator